MRTFEETVEGIADLTIQGATAIAIAATEALAEKIAAGESREDLEAAARKLEEARATEPALRNSLRYCLENYESDPEASKKAIKHFEDTKKRITEIGARRLEDGMTVFTHCHSSTVERIVIEAHKQGKKVRVRNTETRPKFQGRITAKKILEAGIPLEHYVDSAATEAIRGSDIFLFGCDAITSDGRIINKIGTALMLEVAEKYDVPSYSCTDSWKFDPATLEGHDEVIEERDPSEVWEDAPEGIKIHNPAFEVCSPDSLTGMISELGIFKPEALVTEIKAAYPWLIK